jgi:hypothetical protein
MIELKVDPRKDALIGPAMRRHAEKIHRTLSQYKSGKITIDTLQIDLETHLESGLVLAVNRGYDLSTSFIKGKRSGADVSYLVRKAKARARVAAKLIVKTTKKALDVKASVSKKTVASKERATGIIEYEMPRMMFLGMRKGWGQVTGTRQPTKRWITVNENSCEDCQMNEDDGPIPVDDVFSSGDDEPPLHLKCQCLIGLYI